MERGFLRLIGIRNQTRNKIDQEVGDTAVARMLNLRDVLELVVDGFDVTVVNSKIDLLPPQAGMEHPGIPEGEIQKGRCSRYQLVRQSPRLFE